MEKRQWALSPPERPENPRSLQSWAADWDLEAAALRMESKLSEKDLPGPALDSY